MDIQAIQQGLANAAASISGLQTFPSVPDAIDPPSFMVDELELTYSQSFGGLVETLFTAALFAGRGDSDQARANLAGFIAPAGDLSIKAALEADRTLAGACKTLIVERVRGAYRLYQIGSTDYYGALFDVRVWAV